MSDLILTIVAVTWNHAAHQLPLFLHSCALQTRKDFKVVVYHDGHWTDMDLTTSLSARLSDNVCSKFLEDLNIEYKMADPRCNDFGHSLRANSLQWVDTKYLNWQNGDNYLCPNFVEAFMNKMEAENLDFCWSDQLHNYANPGRPYTVLNSQPRQDAIDIANFCIKTEWAKKTGLNHRGRGADGQFVEELLQWYGSSIRIAKLDSVTMVHN